MKKKNSRLVVLVGCLLALIAGVGVAQAAKKIIFFTDTSVPTVTEAAAIAKLNAQAAAPYTVRVVNSRKARLRGSHIETADYLAGTAIPPNYRDGGVDSGTVLYPVFNPDQPPTPPAMPVTQAVFNNGAVVHIPGGGSVTLTISSHTATVSAYSAPDGGT